MNILSRSQILAVAVIDAEEETVVLLLADLPTSMRFQGDPETAPAASDAFGGAWFGAVQDGEVALGFGLVALTEAEPESAVWSLPDPPDDVVAAALGEPHTVVIVPSDAPGVEHFGHGDDETMALLAHATLVDVWYQGPSLAVVAEERRGDRAHAALDGLVDVADADAIRAALKPVRSRMAVASGELVTDQQVVPMAWRPWHYDLVDDAYVGGLLWQWPVIQVFFGLVDPATWTLDAIAPPAPVQRRLLENYLITVRRLAGSLAVNSADSISSKLGPGGEWAVDTVVAPHDDALPALLVTLRLLLDPSEGSKQSFNDVVRALSTAAHAAGLTELVAEMKRWRKAHHQLRLRHLDDLRHELAEELSGEQLGQPRRGPFSGAPDTSPEELLHTFMYGEALHRDEEKERRIAEWDRDPVRGPTTRMEVRADAQAFVHFYGAFGGYVARWLEVAAATDCGGA